MTTPSVSAIVVTWNAGPALEPCLRALLAQSPPRALDVLVVDNGSGDDSVAVARRHPQLTVAALGDNRGFAGGCNEGARRTQGDYLLFLNSDVEPMPDAVERLCAELDGHPRWAAAGGKLVDGGGQPQRGFNVRAFPTLGSAGLELLMLHRLLPGNAVHRRQRMLGFDYDQVAEVDQPAGACLLVRRQAFEAVGGFDESFHPAWFEDVDLCLRLRNGGHALGFAPSAVFRHAGADSLRHLTYAEFLAIWYRNLRRYFAKHHGRGASALLRALTLLGMLARTAALLVVRPEVGRRRALRAYLRVARETAWNGDRS